MITGPPGRWSFCSGSPHADLFFAGSHVMSGDRPRMIPGRGLDWRLAVVPAARTRVIDNWDVTGLRGTGSHDVVAEAVSLPEELTISPFFEPARHDGPLWRFPFFTLIGTMMAGFPLGVARRALDEFTEAAPKKFRPGGEGSLAEEGDVQIALTRAEGRLHPQRSMEITADVCAAQLGQAQSVSGLYRPR